MALAVGDTNRFQFAFPTSKEVDPPGRYIPVRWRSGF